MNQTDSDHALAMLLSQQYDDADYYSRYDHQQDEIDSKPKRKKQKSEKQEGLNTGKFSDEEVVKFKQGLDLYGRDWQRLGEYMGTRDSNAIRSHAQKYFIKLFREEVALPAKVIESGAGYTLSGKPLDPESAAAKPYLKGWVPKTALDQGKAEVAATDKVLEKHTAKKKKKEGDFKPSVAVPKEKTEYANARPLRQRKTAFDPIAVAMQGQEHVMIPCERYQGKPGSGLPGSQPFKIKVCQNALLVVDLHSHLMATEVIGFLAGSWNSKENMLEITQALPCRSVEQDTVHHDRHINVELDPASEVQTRELVEQKGLKIVGWYHSHPKFAPDPSLIDLYNQRNYQNLFREDNSSEPFVGAICAPYDPKLPKSISAFNWFYVGNGDEDKNRPKQLRYDIEPFKIDNEEMMKLVDLIVECGSRSDCVDFGQGWRKDRWESKLEKLKASVESHFVQGDAEFHSFWSIVEREISKWSQNVEE